MQTTHFYLNLSIQVIIIFLIAMISSFIPDTFHVLFGDWFCKGRTYIPANDLMRHGTYVGCDMFSVEHNPDWHWGYRHYIWFFMGFCLFIIQVIRIIAFINKKVS